MLGIEEEALVQVVDERENHEGEVPLHSAKARIILRSEKADHPVAEGKAEDQYDDCQAHHTHLQHNVKKTVLRLGQNPRYRENHTIGFTLQAKPERLVTVAKQRPLSYGLGDRTPYPSASGQGHVFPQQSKQGIRRTT